MSISSKSPEKPHLTVAMLVLEDAEGIAESLLSVRSLANELVVLDISQKKEVAEVATQNGGRVVPVEWKDSFAEAKNRGLEQITGDWVLWLEPGEILTAETASELREHVDRAGRKTVYLLTVEIPPVGPTASVEQIAQPRLMPKLPRMRFEGRVRETLHPAIEALGLKTAMAPGILVRHSRRGETLRKKREAERVLALVAKEMAEREPPAPRTLLAEGEAHANLDNHTAAREAFSEAIRLSAPGSIEMLEAYYGLLTAYDAEPDREEAQLAACLKALEVYPFDAQLLCAMGNYLQKKGKEDLAQKAFETAVQYGQVSLETWHLRDIAELAAICLSTILQGQEKYDEALAILEDALSRHLKSNRLGRQLLDLYVKLGRSEAALRLVDDLEPKAERRGPLRDAIRGAVHATARDWVPALGSLQSAYVSGCNDPFCLRWLAVVLLTGGQTEGVEPILRQWQRQEPHNPEVKAYYQALSEQVAPKVESPSPTKKFRLDDGVSVFEAGPPQMSFITQSSTLEPGI